MLFHDVLDATAARAPAGAALRHQDRILTFAEVRARSLSLAGGFSAEGVGRGDRVAVYLQNRPEVIETALACSRLGAIFVPVNPLLKSRQLAHVLRDCAARVLITGSATLNGGSDQLADLPSLKLRVTCDSVPSNRKGIAGHAVQYDQLQSYGNVPEAAACIDKDPAMILYTSGSTGRPKGVVTSHANVVSGAHCVAAYLHNVAEDRLLAALPLSFDYGFSQVSTAFLVGACAVLTNFSTATALVQEVEAGEITGLAGVPTMWAHLAAGEWPKHAGRSLRYITNSGGSLAPAVLRKLQARLPTARVFSMYGLTEAFRSTFLDPDQLADRPSSIGKAIPNQEVLVVRADGTPCDVGEAGELVHRGSLVTMGYWNDAEATRKRFRPLPLKNGGLLDEVAVWSGDIVRRDEQGYLYFLGRGDQMIKTSGYRVSPTEVEEVALEVPGVVEAVAVGVPDDVLGQKIALAIVSGEKLAGNLVESVRQHCRVNLPAFMVPAYVQRLQEIPRNANGKHEREAVKRSLQELIQA
jgi:acyl-CoA ligase (AMP-forming) (exosortase A-associated)